jgi:integrase
MTKRQALPRGIRLRGDKYFVDVTVGEARRTATCTSIEEAVSMQGKLREALVTGKEVVVRRANARTWTLRDALDKTLSLSKPDGWRDAKGKDILVLNAVDALKFMGETLTLDRINRDLINAWTQSLEARGNSNATINRKVSALSKLLKVAIEHDGLASMPKKPRMRKESVGRIRQITDREEQTLLDTFNRLGMPDHADAVTLLIDTGVRCSELWNVRSEDVDLKHKVLLVYGVEGLGTKNGKYRSVPMTKRVLDIMKRRSNMPMPFPYDNPWMRHAWDRVRGMMGLSDDPNFVPHVCRHSCASRLVKAGVSLPVVQQWMGHSTIQTTMKYAHLMPVDLLNAAAALERTC